MFPPEETTQKTCYMWKNPMDNSEGRQSSDLMASDDLPREGDNSISNTYDDLDKCINDSRQSECLSTSSLI